jgi:hypothetical protein
LSTSFTVLSGTIPLDEDEYNMGAGAPGEATPPLLPPLFNNYFLDAWFRTLTFVSNSWVLKYENTIILR